MADDMMVLTAHAARIRAEAQAEETAMLVMDGVVHDPRCALDPPRCLRCRLEAVTELLWRARAMVPPGTTLADDIAAVLDAPSTPNVDALLAPTQEATRG